MSRYTYPLNQHIQQRWQWLCQFHGIQKPIRLFVMRGSDYFWQPNSHVSYRLGGVCRGDFSIFLFPNSLMGEAKPEHFEYDALSETARIKIAKYLAHEFKHALDFWTIWYRLPRYKAGKYSRKPLKTGFVESVWGKFLAFISYRLHPLELRAWWYSARNWKKFYYILWGIQYTPAVEWIEVFHMFEQKGDFARMFEVAQKLEKTIKR